MSAVIGEAIIGEDIICDSAKVFGYYHAEADDQFGRSRLRRVGIAIEPKGTGEFTLRSIAAFLKIGERVGYSHEAIVEHTSMKRVGIAITYKGAGPFRLYDLSAHAKIRNQRVTG